MADYLTDEYLSKQLDPLPPSKVTSSYRKFMASIIEKLASSNGNLPASWCDEVFNEMPDTDVSHLKLTQKSAKEQLKDMHKKQMEMEKSLDAKPSFEYKDEKKKVQFDSDSKEDQILRANLEALDRINKKDTHKIIKKDPNDERDRIKRQYEMYSKKKEEIDDADKPDAYAAKQSQDLQDDIRSLLSTIQVAPAVTGSGAGRSPLHKNLNNSMGDGIN